MIIGISIARDQQKGLEEVHRKISAYLTDQEFNPADHDIVFTDRYLCGGYGAYDQKIVDTIKHVLMTDGIPLDVTYTGGTPSFFDDLFSKKIEEDER